MNLYSKLVPAGKLIVVDQRGLDDVYAVAESAGALAVSQLPSCEIEPAILIVCPTAVVVLELNVTATVAAGVAQPVATVDDVAMVVVVGVAALLDVDGFELVLPAPLILMSAQVK